MTLYQLLGVHAAADADQLWRAYLRAHAALPRAGWPRCWAWLQGRTEAGLAQAYQVLRDPERRTRYDQQLAATLAIYGMAPGH